MGKLKDLIKEHLFTIIKILLLVLMIGVISFSIGKEIKSINIAETLMLIKSFSVFKILLLIILGLVAVAIITLYDFIIIRYLKLDIKPLNIFTISYVATTINNVSPLGNVAGASIRAIFFKKGDNNTDVLDYNLLFMPATGIGLSLLLIVALINYKYITPLYDQYRFLIFAMVGFLLYLCLYFFIDKLFYIFKKTKVDLNNRERNIVKLKLLMSSTLEWGVAFILFTTIIKHFNQEISPIIILGIFVLSSISGIITMLPGGVGSFDLIALVGFQYYGVSSEHVLAALVVYRVFYYIVPLVVSILFTLIVQAQGENTAIRILNTDKLKDFINRTSSLTNLLLSILIFLSGTVLLISALFPGVAERVRIASTFLSFPILQWSHQISICIGILLITISRDISMKVKRAYKVTAWLLLLGAIFTFLKGFDYEEAIFLGIVLLLLKASKNSFFRKSMPLDWFRVIISSIVALVGVVIYMQLSNKIHLDFLTTTSIKELFIKGFTKFKPSGLITYGSFILYLVFKEIAKEKMENDERYEEVDVDKLSSFLKEYEGGYLTHLGFLHDKHIFWSNTKKVAIIFEKIHNLVFALGDPFGDLEYFGEAVDEFHGFIDEYGYKSIYYQASDKLLSKYHEHGYYFFKLGEMGLVNLDEFDISSSKSRDFRNVLSRFKRDGYNFTLIKPSKIEENMYNSLLAISDEWLKGRNELGFSVGFMNREYIETSPLAIVQEIETGEIIAFATLMPKYDKNSISIDLMRFKEDVPKNSMNFLIVSLMEALKNEGYRTFNLGMAPLSNVGINQYSHYREKLAHIVYKYGKEVYNFGGLRSFKEKFDPQWESRYLIYEDLSMLPASLIEATILIHSKK